MIGKKLWSVVHFIMLLLLLHWNYLAQSGSLPFTISELSNKYFTLFTPASYTFAIWGLIYLSLICMGVYMIITAFRGQIEANVIHRSAPYLFFAYFFTTLWLWFWANDQVMYALVMMFLILGNLILAILRLRKNLWQPNLQLTVFVWWPLDLFFGWICVATIANAAVYLQKIGWNGWGIDEAGWTYLMIAVVCMLGLILIAQRNMREVSYVFIWALIGIAVRNWENNLEIIAICLAGCLSLFAFSVFHASQNQNSLPHRKWRRN